MTTMTCLSLSLSQRRSLGLTSARAADRARESPKGTGVLTFVKSPGPMTAVRVFFNGRPEEEL